MIMENKKILMIEDSDSHAMLIQEMLGEATNISFEVERYVRLSDGLKSLLENKFDVVLLDLDLPDSSGLNTFSSVKKQAEHIPIIILTVNEDDALTISTLSEGAQDYLVKGNISPGLLQRSIRYAIERKKVEVEKEKIFNQLVQSQKAEAIGMLTEGIAHDFNNILSAIRVSNDSILLTIDEENTIYNTLQNIKRSVILAENLVKHLLVFSRKQVVEIKPLNINNLISDIIGMLSRLIGEDIEINTDFTFDIWSVEADEVNIGQIIINILLNARDAMPEGGRIKIETKNVTLNETACKTLSGSKPGNFVCTVIENTGVVMSDEEIRHIFDPFFTTKGKKQGSGLGMTITDEIVRQYGGWINVSSEEGKGSAFSVYLAAVPEKKEEKIEKKVSLESVKGKGERILVVEDEGILREALCRILEHNNYSVFEAKNVKSALSIFEEKNGNFDIVFSDIILTDKTGIELIDELRSRKPDLPILLTSGYYDKAQRDELCEKGYMVIKKPYSLYDLLGKIREVIKG